ncbi:ABC transporter permease [Photobacterium galatheae]|uniref:ABC transporter n=1 Tax=Photobacterium galatheae TaxID=1654360 RepID=A0A066RLA6_9GAMM|nr:ABC transporter permease [Photobacterium galatheae]KDM89911.1 ABC transporter [Photobacterium galatheae]MCM0149747.1 ABC transporter permease [Photobacterium galatheae]
MSWRHILRLELKAIFTNPAIIFTVFGGVLIYSLLYPLPYAQQLPREQQIAVVNLDNSPISRTLVRMVDATPQVKVMRTASSLDEAKQWLLNRDVKGILLIPEHFHRDLLLGSSPTVSFSGDAALFLVYGTVVEGLATATGTLSAKAKVARMVVEGNSIALAAEQYSAMKLSMQPVFNPTMGYINYIIPAVFVFILHQTLIIGTGLVSATQNEARTRGEHGYWDVLPAWQILFVRVALFTLIYVPLCAYYFGLSFDTYGISRLASMGDMVAMTLPFLISVAAFGVVVGELLPRKELVTVVVVLSSLPLVFSMGFVWPVSALPDPVHWLAQLIPATPAINGFLRLNQMGASFAQVSGWWLQLWGQAGFYALIAFALIQKKRRQLLQPLNSMH